MLHMLTDVAYILTDKSPVDVLSTKQVILLCLRLLRTRVWSGEI